MADNRRSCCRIHVLVTLLVGLLLTAAVTAHADELAENTEKLKQLRRQIEQATQSLSSARGERDATRKALRQIELDIGATSASLHRLQAEADTLSTTIDELQLKRQAQLAHLGELREVLQQALRAAYVTGRQQRIKLLLNQQQPARIGRMLAYHGYLTRARADRMQALRSALDELGETESALRERQARVEENRLEQAARAERLAREQAEREQVLARLQDSVKQQERALGGLQQDEQELQALLASLQEALRRLAPPADAAVSLRTLKGKLEWPLPGRLTRGYGARQANSELRTNGVFIAAPAGTDVQAIAAGRVAFADWLRGFGLLLIIDHGDGYMSLYGQNRSLYRETGDWVSRGDIVAAAGNSGGQLRDGLYLELRKDGRPFDPAPWFSGKPARLQAGR